MFVAAVPPTFRPSASLSRVITCSPAPKRLASADGLYRFDPNTGAREHFRHDPKDPRSLPADTVTRVYREAGGTLWVGTSNGLARWDGEGRGFTVYRRDAADPHSLGGAWVTDNRSLGGEP